jgi:hypothetical protein
MLPPGGLAGPPFFEIRRLRQFPESRAIASALLPAKMLGFL